MIFLICFQKKSVQSYVFFLNYARIFDKIYDYYANLLITLSGFAINIKKCAFFIQTHFFLFSGQIRLFIHNINALVKYEFLIIRNLRHPRLYLLAVRLFV